MPGGAPGDVLGAGGCRAASLPHPLHAGSTPSHESHRHPQLWPSVPRGQNPPCPVSAHSVKCVLQSRYVISVRLFCQMLCGCLKGECFCHYGPESHTCVPSTRNTSTNTCDRCVRFCWSCYSRPHPHSQSSVVRNGGSERPCRGYTGIPTARRCSPTLRKRTPRPS